MCLRVVVPSWRFFDRIVPGPRLLYRMQAPGAEFEPWEPLFRDETRPLSALLFNPRGNLRLAYYGLLEQLTDDLAELADADQAERLVSYALVRDLVRHHLPRPLLAVRGLQYQFKLSQPAQLSKGAAEEQDIVISRLHSAG